MPVLQIISDIHAHAQSPVFRGRNVSRDADYLVLAGDNFTGSVQDYLRWLQDIVSVNPDLPVIMILGNHEYYGQTIPDFRLLLAERIGEAFPQVHLLENSEVVFPGIRFIGATLWSKIPAEAQTPVSRALTDYRAIRVQDGAGGHRLFVPENSTRLCEQSEKALSTLARSPGLGRTVVVTHHLPLLELVADMWKGSPVNSGFASNLAGLVRQVGADLWVFGHSHNPTDTVSHGTRFVSNPVGYSREPYARPDVLNYTVTV